MDNSNYWKGIFYINKNDHRVIVPKQDKALGWTLNWGQPKTFFVLILIILMVFLLTQI